MLEKYYIDNLYLRLFRDLLDAILMKYCHGICRSMNITCCIYGATRRRVKKAIVLNSKTNRNEKVTVDFTPDEEDKLLRNFGIKDCERNFPAAIQIL